MDTKNNQPGSTNRGKEDEQQAKGRSATFVASCQHGVRGVFGVEVDRDRIAWLVEGGYLFCGVP